MTTLRVIAKTEKTSVAIHAEVLFLEGANTGSPHRPALLEHDRIVGYFCCLDEDARATYYDVTKNPDVFIGFAIDRMHHSRAGIVSGRTVFSREDSAFKSHFIVHLPSSLANRKWYIAIALQWVSQLAINATQRPSAPRDALGRLWKEKKAPYGSRTKFDDDEAALQTGLRRLGNRTKNTGSTYSTNVLISELCLTGSDDSLSPLTNHVSSRDALASSSRKRNLFFERHFFIRNAQQIEDLAGHFYRFLMGTNRSRGSKRRGRRFCSLRAAQLTIPILLSDGLRSLELDSFVSFLRDAQSIVSTHRGSINVESRVNDSHARAARSQHRLTHASRLREESVRTYTPLSLDDIVDCIISLNNVPPSTTVSQPWIVSWLDYLLLVGADADLWRHLLQPFLRRWNTYEGNWQDVDAHIADASSPDVSVQRRVATLLLDETLCPYRSKMLADSNGAVLRKGSVGLSMILPPEVQELLLMPYGGDDFFEQHIKIPIVTTKTAAIHQMRALARCTVIGDAAGAELCFVCYRRWVFYWKESREIRRRNILIKGALERKFSSGNLQLRYFKKWLAWTKRARLRRFSRRRTVTLP